MITSEYRKMLSDGIIDDNELAVLIIRMNELKNNAISLTTSISNKKEQILLNSIIEAINNEISAMSVIQSGTDKYGHKLGM